MFEAMAQVLANGCFAAQPRGVLLVAQGAGDRFALCAHEKTSRNGWRFGISKACRIDARRNHAETTDDDGGGFEILFQNFERLE